MPPFSWDLKSGNFEVSGAPLKLLRRLRDFAGFDRTATFMWPRWIFLRVIGFILIMIFLDYARFGTGMVGTNGVWPAAVFLGEIARKTGGIFSGFFDTPTLFWLSSSAGMLAAVTWLGLLSALLLCLNLLPRVGALMAWIALLSLLNVTEQSVMFRHDYLISESVFLGIFLAPPGWRPGLGRKSPPSRFAILLLRWLLLRLMLESGMGKVMSDDEHWHDFTALDLHQEAAPFPTFAGYLDQQLPHWYHVGQILLMFAAELAAPFFALYSQKGRLVAFLLWTVFQGGIVLTANFGFLNMNATVLGVLLLDDQVLCALSKRLRLPRLNSLLAAGGAPAVLENVQKNGRWRWFVSAPLALSGIVSLFAVPFYLGIPFSHMPAVLDRADYIFRNLRFSSDYRLYKHSGGTRLQIEFEGSDDNGKSWRAYPFRYLPQNVSRLPPYLAPYFPRFEAMLGIAGGEGTANPVIGAVAAGLLRGSPEVTGLFRSDPFGGHAPGRVATRLYELHFTDLDEYRATGQFWSRKYLRDFAPELPAQKLTQ